MISLVVVPAEVKHAVNRRLGEVDRVLRADDDVAQFARPRDLPAVLSIGNDRTSVGSSLAAMLAVQLADPPLVHQLHREVAVLDARGGEHGQRSGDELVRHVRMVDQSPERVRSACSS